MGEIGMTREEAAGFVQAWPPVGLGWWKRRAVA